MSYQLGLFLQVTNNKKAEWQKQIKVINSLLNVDFIEIWLEYFPAKGELKFFKKLVKNYSLNIHAPFLDTNFCAGHREINQASLEIIKKTINCAAELKAKLVTFHGGKYSLSLSKEKALYIMTPYIKILQNYSKKKNVKIAIENLPTSIDKLRHNFPISLADLVMIKNKISNIMFTLDIGHAVQEKENYQPFLKKYLKNIHHIHLHDAIRGGKAHLEVGKGNFDFKDFLAFLKRIGYNHTISLEVWGEDVIRSSWNKIIKLKSS